METPAQNSLWLISFEHARHVGSLLALAPSAEEARVQMLQSWRDMSRNGLAVHNLTLPFVPSTGELVAREQQLKGELHGQDLERRFTYDEIQSMEWNQRPLYTTLLQESDHAVYFYTLEGVIRHGRIQPASSNVVLVLGLDG